jgi:hypothetical protein
MTACFWIDAARFPRNVGIVYRHGEPKIYFQRSRECILPRSGGRERPFLKSRPSGAGG